MDLRYLLLPVFFLLSGLMFGQQSVNGSFAFQTDPSKDYALYIPSSYNTNQANGVMLGLHPLNTSRWNAVSWRDTLIDFAESNNLILVCPDGGSDGRIDDAIDTAFTTVLLDSVRHWYTVDSSRTYVMGFSWGGRATYTYGFRRARVFGGYIPIGAAITNLNEVSASLVGNVRCKPVYIVHGANDASNSRYFPIRNALQDSGAILNSILMSGVGHTIDFPNRNQILTDAFQWIDSVNMAPYLAQAGNDTSICSGSSIPLGMPSAALGGICPYTYSWTPVVGLDDPNSEHPMATPTTLTTYVLTVTDRFNRVSQDSITIDIIQGPLISQGPDGAICTGDSFQLSISGGLQYSWQPSTSLSCSSCPQPWAKPTATTLYQVTVTDTGLCPSIANINLRVNPLPSVSAGGLLSLCRGDSLQLQATGAASYQWSPVTGLDCSQCPNPKASPQFSTLYTIQGTDSNGCENSGQVIIDITPTVAVDLGPDLNLCDGDSIPFSYPGPSGVNLQWSPAQGLSCTTCVNPLIKPAGNTTYWVMGTDQNGCNSYDSLAISVVPPPIAQASEDTGICRGESLLLSASGGSAYAWSPVGSLQDPNVQNPIASPALTTRYIVVVSDTNGCQDSASLLVEVYNRPSSLFNFRVNGDSVKFTELSTGAVQWNWDFGDGQTSSDPNPQHVYDSSATYQVCLTVTNEDACTDTFCRELMVSVTTAIGELQELGEWKVFPNPATDEVVLQLELRHSKGVEIKLLNAQGQILDRMDLNGQVGRLKQTWNLSSYTAGLYFLEYRNVEGLIFRDKVLKVSN